MTEFKPSYKHRCEDPKCPSYGEPCVDRGYGYPVCPSQKWRSARYQGSEDKPIDPFYMED
jgi:hypothetical protein